MWYNLASCKFMQYTYSDASLASLLVYSLLPKLNLSATYPPPPLILQTNERTSHPIEDKSKFLLVESSLL